MSENTSTTMAQEMNENINAVEAPNPETPNLEMSMEPDGNVRLEMTFKVDKAFHNNRNVRKDETVERRTGGVGEISVTAAAIFPVSLAIREIEEASDENSRIGHFLKTEGPDVLKRYAFAWKECREALAPVMDKADRDAYARCAEHKLVDQQIAMRIEEEKIQHEIRMIELRKKLAELQNN